MGLRRVTTAVSNVNYSQHLNTHMAENKGFKPSAKRLREARQRGQVLKSPLVSQVAGFTFAGALLLGGCGSAWVRLQMLIEYCLAYGYRWPEEVLRQGLGLTIEVGGSCLACAGLGGLLGECLQVGVRFEWQAVQLRFEKASLVGGLKRIFQRITCLWIYALKIVLLAALGLCFCLKEIPDIVAVVPLSVEKGAGLLLCAVRQVFFGASAILCVGAGVEYLIRRRQFMRELSMSLDEVRREHKEEEGDPHIRALRRSLHESLALQDIVSRVRKSKVIVVNR